MTHEEALNKAINIVSYFEAHFAKSKEAREDAVNIIEALEQELCDDAISRQAVLEMAYDMSEIDGEHFTEPWMVVDVEDIQKLPSVKQEPKKGYWIRGHHGFGCSNCHKSIEGVWDDSIDDITGTLFCPNCGAKMESETEQGLSYTDQDTLMSAT